jgi:hypothetical protein
VRERGRAGGSDTQNANLHADDSGSLNPNPKPYRATAPQGSSTPAFARKRIPLIPIRLKERARNNFRTSGPLSSLERVSESEASLSTLALDVDRQSTNLRQQQRLD